MTEYAYGRCSTVHQDLQLQLDAFKAAGIAKKDTYTDKASGKSRERPGLEKVLALLEPGDRLTVWKLDRLGRSLIDLVTIVTRLGEHGIEFRSLTEGFDTKTPMGRMVFHIFAALAEYERAVILERSAAGLAAAAAKGNHGGRRRVLSDEQAAEALVMYRKGEAVAHIARVLNVSRPVVYRAVRGTHGYPAADPGQA